MTQVPNPELLLFVLWSLGATGRYIDIEDAVVEAFRLSPSKFGWRTKPFPSDKTGDQALRDLQKESKSLVMVSDNRELQLSPEGVRWVQENLERLKTAVAQGVTAGAERPSQRPLVELESVDWVRTYAAGFSASPGRRVVAEVLHLTPDAGPIAWRERSESLRSAAVRSERLVVLRFLDRLEEEHSEWFGVGK